MMSNYLVKWFIYCMYLNGIRQFHQISDIKITPKEDSSFLSFFFLPRLNKIKQCQKQTIDWILGLEINDEVLFFSITMGKRVSGDNITVAVFSSRLCKTEKVIPSPVLKVNYRF